MTLDAYASATWLDKQAGATSLRRSVSTEDRTSTSWGKEEKNIAARCIESGLRSEFAQLLTDSLDTGSHLPSV